MTTSEIISKSLLYERAFSKLSVLILKERTQRNVDLHCAKAAGEDRDKSWDVLISDLEKLKRKYRSYADELWNGAEKNGAFQPDAVQELLSAVVLRAANDYELAVSGEGNAEEMARIEKFAEEDAGGFTKIYFPDVLKRIRECQPKFARIARENILEIMAESERSRRNHHADMSGNKHRCPLCGGGLYTQTKRGSPYQIVCCSGCSLREVVEVRKKGRKRND